ncbi:MAG: orotidine-5'-phosphate decarboxylase [Patescibacteria group bacterium]|nr:orotidine-5'-phosphate decarboxylase [Patescibacteria group bacterium]
MSSEVYRNTIQQPSDRVIVALDKMNWEQAGEVMSEVGEHVGMAKANSIAQKLGWIHAVEKIASFGAATMADAKYHDIPDTVRLHIAEAADCNPQFITIHASSVVEMLKAAAEGRDQIRETKKGHYSDDDVARIGGILGVTVLTSIGEEDCVSIYGDSPKKKVLQFARIAKEAGIDGIVCSGKELKIIREQDDLNDLLTVVPGITPAWAQKAGDQKRVVTPTEAIQNGADFIVVGRAITQPPEGISRAEAAQRIAQELGEA